MIKYENLPTDHHRKTLDLYRQEGHVKAWNYWRLMGYNYGILVDVVQSEQFISPTELSYELSVTDGYHTLYDNTTWFKCILDGRIVLFPRYPIRNQISYDHLYDKKCVSEHDCQIVTIDGDDYQVTLFHGANHGVSLEVDDIFDHTCFEDSEWDKLIFPTMRKNDSNYKVPFNIWAKYSNTQLSLDNSQSSNGCWTQEKIDASVSGQNTDLIIIRGLYGATGTFKFKPHANSNHCAWRPLLRKLD